MSPVEITEPITEPSDRMAPARAAAARRAHEKRADWLRERGYLCVAPGDVVSVRVYPSDVAHVDHLYVHCMVFNTPASTPERQP